MNLILPYYPLTNTGVNDAHKVNADLAALAAHTHAVTDQTINFIIDGGGSEITTGIKGYFIVPRAITLTGWTVVSDAAADAVIDLWETDYAGHPADSGDSIIGAGTKPSFSSSDKGIGNTSDWATLRLVAGDIVTVNVDSVATMTLITLGLNFTG